MKNMTFKLMMAATCLGMVTGDAMAQDRDRPDGEHRDERQDFAAVAVGEQPVPAVGQDRFERAGDGGDDPERHGGDGADHDEHHVRRGAPVRRGDRAEGRYQLRREEPHLLVGQTGGGGAPAAPPIRTLPAYLPT